MHHRISSPFYLHRDVVLALGCTVSLAYERFSIGSKVQLEDVPIILEVTRNFPLRIIRNGYISRLALIALHLGKSGMHGTSSSIFESRMPVGAGA